MGGIVKKRKGIDQVVGIARETVGGVDALPAIRTTDSREEVGGSTSAYDYIG